jgi:hypothetical protein
MSKEQNLQHQTDTNPAIDDSKLYQFSQSSLAQLPRDGLEESSTSAILACAFLMGAARNLDNDPKVLLSIIAAYLNIDDRGSTHLIDTTQRLINKYPFIEEIFKQGSQTAQSWQRSDDHTDAAALTDLLQQNQNLTLMDLDIQGITAEPGLATAKRKTVQRARGGKLLRIALIILILIVIGAANYFILTTL